MLPEFLCPSFDRSRSFIYYNSLVHLQDVELSIDQIGLIKSLQIKPVHFINFGFFSGGSPDINPTESVTKTLESQGLNTRQALKLQDLMLLDFDMWEYTRRFDSEKLSQISQTFKEIYGFSPEDLQTAYEQAQVDFKNGNFHITRFLKD